jgi:hypothetical protein
MDNHSSNAYVQEYGCQALGNLAFNENYQVTIAEAGGITTILSAMKKYSWSSPVQHYGCEALFNFAYNNDNNKMTISKAGGKFAVESAIQNHSSNIGVYEKA